MKTKYSILLGLLAICFTACTMDSSTNSTPQMSILTSHVNKTDTLNIYYTDQGGVLRLDTINVGDTIVFRLYLNGVTNNLTNFNLIQSDSTVAKLIYPIESSTATIISNSQSNFANGTFVFLPKQVQVYFPVRYVAKKPTTSATVQFSLSSDANFNSLNGSNTFSMTLKTPIKAKLTQ